MRDVLLCLENMLEFKEIDDEDYENFEMNEIVLKDICEQLTEYDKNTIAYTVIKLYEADFIQANIDQMYVTGITFDGHKFLDSVRSKSIWNEIKDSIRKNGIDISINAIWAAVAKIIESRLA